MDPGVRPWPNSGPSDPLVHQKEVLRSSLPGTVTSRSGLDRSRVKDSSKQRPPHKKREKSPSRSSSKKRASSATSKLGERPCTGTGVSGSHKESGTILPALGKSTLKPALCVGAGPSLALAREKQKWVPPTQTIPSHSCNESLVPKTAMRPMLSIPQKEGSPSHSLESRARYAALRTWPSSLTWNPRCCQNRS